MVLNNQLIFGQKK